MLKVQRQCATIQVTVFNENGVMVFDQSASAEAPRYLEGILQDAIVHEVRIVEGRIANQFHDRIADLQRQVRDLQKGKPLNGGDLSSETVIDAEFIALPAPKDRSYDA